MSPTTRDLKFKKILIAPCGMDCNVCKAYLAHAKKLSKIKGRPQCIGCRPRKKKCAFLKGHCTKIRDNEITFCFECKDFPCQRLLVIDKRYRTRYNTSLVGNLKKIKKAGISKFLKAEQKRWKCPKCGGTISIHDGECYDCENMSSNL